MVRNNRKFQLWRYTVGLRQLLLRSVKSDQEGTRIDILFMGVQHICIPTTIEDIAIDEVEPDSIPAWLRTLLSNVPYVGKVFLVSGNHGTGYVVAGVLAHHEDDGEFYAPGKFDADGLMGAL
jgi:hypothetical protein